jgi:hypothetical protein
LGKPKIKNMKDLNIHIEKAAMPKRNPATSVNRKFLYSLCAALLLLTCSLTTNAKSWYSSLPGYGYGFLYSSFLYTGGTGTSFSDAYDLNDHTHSVYHYLGFTSPGETWFTNTPCTSCSPLSGEMFLKLTVADDGYVTISGGTTTYDFDSVFDLYDSGYNLITSGDDGVGAGVGNGTNYHPAVQPLIQEYLSAGTYYLKVYGTAKYGAPATGTVNIDFNIQ